ncbi:KGGVGR-motif variant AAA ATPase [Flavobacterium sp. FlaQc-47]|uniref:KGGVGR-motif variant AAA ATPase n=1 Tax=Flavobacterium sp. FlaQc-47 TaxID=3374180 RepID=UPI003757F6E7
MKTITFYSYKGGVGRSLALVNIATRLVEFGKKVCVIDFDLEAPGLHLKFPLSKNNYKKNHQGIVDYVFEFSNNGILNNKIKNYCIEVNISKNGKPLSLITAGNTESSDYWKKLSSINWYDLIYENPNGLAFFLSLKEKIKNEIKPDFLLIDSRTGISEMSGITLSLLADEIVIVAANNKENLGGANRIIKSINNPDNNILEKTPNINFVLSRVPFTDKPEDRAKESLLINRIKREYLHPYLNEVSVIHSDRELEEFESVKIAYEKDDSNTQISIDYLKLFEKLTKNDLSENEIRRFKNIRESERLIVLANNSDTYHQKIEYANKAIALNKNNIDFYIYRSNIYYEIEEYENSILDVKNALKLNENYLPAINMLINNLIKQEKFDEAQKKTDLFLELKPKDINPLIKKVIIFTKTKKYKEAEAFSSEIIILNPEFSGGYSCRANTRRLLKKFDDALDDVFKALELDSENLQAIATLAEIYAETGKINEFYIHLENALKLDSEYMERTINEEDIYIQFTNEERFLALLSKYGIYFNNYSN